jgi:transposase
VIAVVEHLLIEHPPAVVPGSMLGEALQYLNRQWHKPSRYVENGDWPISNNACEDENRPTSMYWEAGQ